MIVATVSEKVDMKQSELDSFKDEPGLTLSALPLSERAYSVTSEPPAYQKRTSSSVQIARLIAVTVVAVALILGAAIIAAAYIQSMNNNRNGLTAPSSETANVNKAGLSSALTGDESHDEDTHINNIDTKNHSTSNDDSSNEEEDKDHRRLDTEPDLLEEFLENEGKILRLPISSGDLHDFDVDIEELAKMFMKRNPLDKSKCVVQRTPFGASADHETTTTLPITSENASSIPIFPIISGERISIICSGDGDDATEEDDEDDSGIISARPLMLPALLGMRPPSPPANLRFAGQPNTLLRSSLVLNDMNSNPFGAMMSAGPFSFNPMMNNPNPFLMAPPPQQRMNNNFMFRPQPPSPPFGVSPPWMNHLDNEMEHHQQQQRARNFNMPPPPQFGRSPIPSQPDQRPFRFPVEASQQFQQFQQFPQHIEEHSTEKISEMQKMTPPPPPPPTPQAPQVFRLPPPDLPETLLRFLEDLPELDHPVQPISQPPKQQQQQIPVFRLAAKPIGLSAPPQPETSSQRAQPLPARPVNMLPFFRIRPAPPSADEKSEVPSFFERLLDSLLSVGGPDEMSGNNNNNRKVDGKIHHDSMPMESRMTPVPIRTGSRALRIPMDVASPPSGILQAQPIEGAEEDGQPIVITPAVGEDRVARSHLIQPRSVVAN